jgi:hypothetical protein
MSSELEADWVGGDSGDGSTCSAGATAGGGSGWTCSSSRVGVGSVGGAAGGGGSGAGAAGGGSTGAGSGGGGSTGAGSGGGGSRGGGSAGGDGSTGAASGGDGSRGAGSAGGGGSTARSTSTASVATSLTAPTRPGDGSSGSWALAVRDVSHKANTSAIEATSARQRTRFTVCSSRDVDAGRTARAVTRSPFQSGRAASDRRRRQPPGPLIRAAPRTPRWPRKG